MKCLNYVHNQVQSHVIQTQHSHPLAFPCNTAPPGNAGCAAAAHREVSEPCFRTKCLHKGHCREAASQQIPPKTVPLQNSDKAFEGQPYNQHVGKIWLRSKSRNIKHQTSYTVKEICFSPPIINNHYTF